MTTCLKCVVYAFLLGTCLASHAAENKGAETLAERLQQYYKSVKAIAGAPETTHLRPLFVQQPGILSVSPDDVAYLDVCPSTFHDGAIHSTPGYFCSELAHKQWQSLKVSQRVFVTGLQVNLTADKVEVHLTTCDRCETVSGQPNLRSLVIFVFPRGYLSQATADEVIGAIDTLLTAVPVSDPTANVITKPAVSNTGLPSKQVAPPSASPPTGQPPEIATIKIGMTCDEVQKLLGKPQSIVDLGAKLIYVYPNLRVLFMNGKLTDVQ